MSHGDTLVTKHGIIDPLVSKQPEQILNKKAQNKIVEEKVSEKNRKKNDLKVRVQKKIRDYLGIFPKRGGGGSSQFPKLKTKKKRP